MILKIGQATFGGRNFLRSAVSVGLLIGGFYALASGQVTPANEPGDLYGGIELSVEGVKAVALRVSRGEEGPGVKLVYSEMIHLALGPTSDGTIAPQAPEKAATAVQKLHARLRRQYQVLPERIFLIGSSGLQAQLSEELSSAISRMTGKKLTFLDTETEVQLKIVGTIPLRNYVGDTWIDDRNSSVLIEIGNHSTRAGYQLLRYAPSVEYDFVAMNIREGAMSYANAVSRSAGEGADWLAILESAKTLSAASIRAEIKKERETKPGLLNRKRVYLAGAIVWAMATLLYPEERQMFISLTTKDIALFAAKAARNPHSLLKPNLSRISDLELRREIEKEANEVRGVFSPQQLVSGAELLKAIAADLNWREKKIIFARYGEFSCILSYVRLQTENSAATMK